MFCMLEAQAQSWEEPGAQLKVAKISNQETCTVRRSLESRILCSTGTRVSRWACHFHRRRQLEVKGLCPGQQNPWAAESQRPKRCSFSHSTVDSTSCFFPRLVEHCRRKCVLYSSSSTECCYMSENKSMSVGGDSTVN